MTEWPGMEKPNRQMHRLMATNSLNGHKASRPFNQQKYISVHSAHSYSLTNKNNGFYKDSRHSPAHLSSMIAKDIGMFIWNDSARKYSLDEK